MNFSIGDTVGGYEIVGVLGSGGMGEVYRVRNVISDRVDAMKVLLASLQRDQDFATRFLREIKVQARLVHPNIAQLYTAFEHQGNLMMILELVDGMSLLDMLQHGRLPLLSAVDYASQALTALSYAHAQDVIHRDIKPGNIMVTRAGAVKLMDFGIAKAATDRSLTVTGSLIGSLYYMSPEQVRAEAIDRRSDLYSVGVVLYQMATGRKPFEGDSEYSIMRAQVEHAPPPPSAIDVTVPEELSGVIVRALAKNPAERFQTGEEFREALQPVAMLLREDEIGTTRLLGGPPRTTGAPAQQPRRVPEAQRETTAGQNEWRNAAHREEGAPASTTEAAAPSREDRLATAPRTAGGAGEPSEAAERPSARSRTPLWIAAAIAAAVLVVAGTQLFDWMNSAPPARSQAVTRAPVERQPPPDQAPAQASPQPPPAVSDGLETPASSTPPPKDVPRAAPAASAAASGPARTASQSQAREAPGRAPAEPAPRPPALSSAERVPPRTTATDRGAAVPAPSPAAPVVPRPSPGGSQPSSGPTTRRPSETASQTPDASGDAPAGTAPSGTAPSGTAPSGTASEPAANAEQPPVEESSSSPASSPASPAPAQPTAIDPVYDPAEVEIGPRLLRQVQPLYTEAAQKAGVQGRVRLAAEIWPDGRAHNIRVIQSVGHPDLDRNAVAALSRWQFTPGRKNGAPVKVRAVIDQTYRLQGGRSTPALTKDP
jgi:serine/threonine-protein kinase